MAHTLNFLLSLIFLQAFIHFSHGLNEDPTIVGGPSHECYRKCVAGETKTCVYNFTLSLFTTMSVDCGDCPYNVTDCFNPHCVTAGGAARIISAVNHMVPGPSIHVCENDTIVVNVVNGLSTESTTIHWHGVHQIGTPWMDGVPFLTQCPIAPHNSFQYRFSAYPPATQMYHSHIGLQIDDGVYGTLVIRSPRDFDNKLYDYDLPEHSMTIWHWFKESAETEFYRNHFRNEQVPGYDMIINGKASKEPFVRNNKTYTTPREVFTVTKGKRYRFRMAFNTAIFCPVQVSIDNHTLTMISTDTGEFEPVEVESFMATAGERFDFVLNANQSVGSYWIRFRGVGVDCANPILGNYVHQEAILRYEGTNLEQPLGEPTYNQSNRPGKILNPMQVATVSYPPEDVISIADLKSIDSYNISGTPDEVFYMLVDINTYSGIPVPGRYPQINNLSFAFPPVPLLTQFDDLDSSMYCTDKNPPRNCVNGHCTCPYIYNYKKNSLVEIVIVDDATEINEEHPMHLHGGNFHVVAMDVLGDSISVEKVKELNENGKIKKNFYSPVKDTVSVPNRGYAVLRYYAFNPGFWFFHCHITNHAELGMAVVVQIGDLSSMPKAPSDFPKCGNWA